MAQVKVSVLIPLYSAERYIGNIAAHFSRIQSSDVEFVLADQHCFDDAASRLEDLAGDDTRVRVFQTTDALRWWENYNFLLERARGEYVIILAQDDRLPHDWFAKVVGELDANPEAVAAYGPVEVIDDRDIVSMPHNNMAKHPEVFGQRWRVLSALLYFAGIAYPGAKLGLVRRRVLVDGALSIPETAGHTGLSTFVWFFAILLRGPILFHPELLVQRRVHPLSYTSRQATFGIGSQLARLFSYWSEGTSVWAGYYRKDQINWWVGPVLLLACTFVVLPAVRLSQWSTSRVKTLRRLRAGGNALRKSQGDPQG